ncbi:MAG: alanine racemase [Chloroflexota bacterium]
MTNVPSIDTLETPALWTDLDTLERNISQLAAHFGKAGVNWRPHTKGIKVPEVAQMAIDAGAIGVTCAKIGEAEVMVNAGITDILIANQVVSPGKIARLVELCKTADVKVAVDSAENMAQIGEIAAASDVEVGVLVDINTGMNRTGVSPDHAVVDLSQTAVDTPGIRYRGLMTWEGHVLAQPTEEQKRAEIEKSIGKLQSVIKLCEEAGLTLDIISGGGSGTSNVTPFLPGITEIQAGGAIFCDVRYRSWGVITTPSIFVRVMVTSRPAPDRIVTDAGFKSLSTWAAMPEPVRPVMPHFVKLGSSAEHGTIMLSEPDDTIAVGDTIDFMVGYGDATVHLHDVLYGVRNNGIETEWQIAGRGKFR